MKIKSIIVAIAAMLSLYTVDTAQAAEVTTVSSLEELMPYLKMDNVNVKMAPGTYIFTAKDAQSKIFRTPIEVVEGRLTYAMIPIFGSNSTYDFTDVTIEVETVVFNAYENCEFVELHILGSNNVVKNLKLQDVGSPDDFPQWGCVNVVIDGANNRIDGVEIRSTGSTPYGYGELFGKGGPTTIKHKKHSACLVRGYQNHVKDCKIYHRAYGHCLFMQAADKPLIEGTYIEGTMTTTDKVLEERGSGSKADKINFKTVWGYEVPTGYTIALTEAGIRAYDSGNTIVDGVRITKRGTSNATVRGCTVKHARVGVVISHSKGQNLIEDCTAIGTERGFAVGDGGKILRCRTDVAFGPALVMAYDRTANVTADITIIPYPEGENKYMGNGSGQIALIKGVGHNISIKRDPSLKDSDIDKNLTICVGGDDNTIGARAKVNEYRASDMDIYNETTFPILIDKNGSEIRVKTKGEVVDNGEKNTITKL
ncbi:MAG: right-handed parallel beta-helix repeat-containing protein [Rikenellaceae bacterium]